MICINMQRMTQGGESKSIKICRFAVSEEVLIVTHKLLPLYKIVKCRNKAFRVLRGLRRHANPKHKWSQPIIKIKAQMHSSYCVVNISAGAVYVMVQAFLHRWLSSVVVVASSYVTTSWDAFLESCYFPIGFAANVLDAFSFSSNIG